MINYRLIDYKEHTDRKQIAEMYHKVFSINAYEQYDFLYKGKHFDCPLGVIAIDDDNGMVVGHFTSVRAKAIVNGRNQHFRMSMGFMTDPDYRGKGIATMLYNELKKHILDEKEEYGFVVGFPNENSFKMHIERMEYEQFRTLHFVQLPMEKNLRGTIFTAVDTVSLENEPNNDETINKLIHDEKFLNERYKNKKYEIFRSSNGNYYICTQFGDKMDILYWSDYTNEEELLEFAAELYKRTGVNRITTWNSVDFLDKYPGEKRQYHMCINYLNCDDAHRAEINNPWVFFMGDCELF